jgi:hypothetical protein
LKPLCFGSWFYFHLQMNKLWEKSYSLLSPYWTEVWEWLLRGSTQQFFFLYAEGGNRTIFWSVVVLINSDTGQSAK